MFELTLKEINRLSGLPAKFREHGVDIATLDMLIQQVQDGNRSMVGPYIGCIAPMWNANSLSMMGSGFEPYLNAIAAATRTIGATHVTLQVKSLTLANRTTVNGYDFTPIPGVNVFHIINPPQEKVVGELTYRILEFGSYVFVFNSEDPIYNFLDVGCVLSMSFHDGKVHWAVSREMNFQVIRIMGLLSLNPILHTLLDYDCVIDLDELEGTLATFEKRNKQPDTYQLYYNTWFLDYQKAGNRRIIDRLLKDEIPTYEYRDITFTKTRATYHNVYLEADDLFSRLSTFNFEAEIDIYMLAKFYISKKIDLLAANPAEPCTFTINGIPISVRHSGTFTYINDVRINKLELVDIAYRATCLSTVAQFTDLLKRISAFSLKYTDYVANGMPVKISPMPNPDDYNNRPLSDLSWARLKFKMDNKKVRLILEPGVEILIKSFPEFVKGVEVINYKTNGRYDGMGEYIAGRYTRSHKNSDFARRQLKELIGRHAVVLRRPPRVKTTKVVAPTVTPTGHVAPAGPPAPAPAPRMVWNGRLRQYVPEKIRKPKPVLEQIGHQILDNKINLDKYFETTTCDAEKAVEKSKQFLAQAAAATKAVEETIKGRRYYIVQGTKNTYRVDAEDAKVYNHTTNQYICIVNSRHYQGVGYDDVAARLYALKNDSIMQDKITTLKR